MAPLAPEEQSSLLKTLRLENASLLREARWARQETGRLQELAAALEARLEEAKAMQRKTQPQTQKPQKPQRRVMHATMDNVDWSVFYMFGAGMRELQSPDAHKWDDFAVDWTNRGLPKGVMPKEKFWDHRLPLDWNADGLPKIAYPVKVVDLGARQARKRASKRGTYGEVGDVDWKVFTALSPKGETATAFGKMSNMRGEQDPQIIKARREERAARAPTSDANLLFCDWSARMPPLFKPVRCDAVGGARRARPNPRRGSVGSAPPSAALPVEDKIVVSKKKIAAHPPSGHASKLVKVVTRRPVNRTVRQPGALGLRGVRS